MAMYVNLTTDLKMGGGSRGGRMCSEQYKTSNINVNQNTRKKRNGAEKIIHNNFPNLKRQKIVDSKKINF